MIIEKLAGGKDFTLDVFDLVIMAIGGALILIGLYLFVAGKKQDASGNHVEGFGIKLNVSNPSIILIVLGIGLLLVPRLLPNQIIPIDTYTQNPTQPPVEESPPIQGGETFPETAEPQKTSTSVFLPTGNWYLSNYEENGIDLSANVSGTMQFMNKTENSVNWTLNLSLLDIWGNQTNYLYNGNLQAVSGGYNMSITYTSVPGSPLSTVPVDLKLEQNNRLHMGYFYQGSNLVLHYVPQ